MLDAPSEINFAQRLNLSCCPDSRGNYIEAGEVIGEHARLLGRHQVRYDPWHYVGVLQRKPGALRNGAPFRDWQLPEPLLARRQTLGTHADGDRQFVGILGAVLPYGLEAVSAACAQALQTGAASRDVVLNLLARLKDPVETPLCAPGGHLPALSVVPIADCARYDALLKGDPNAAR